MNVFPSCLSKLARSDVVVAEVTQPSLGVGYEIGRTVELGKPLLCLYRPVEGRLLSAMIRGLDNGGLRRCQDYEEKELAALLDSFFRRIESDME